MLGYVLQPRREQQQRGISRFKILLALKPGRVKYKAAGKAQRDAVKRATKAGPKLTRFDYRVLMAVQALTTSYSKRSDRMAVSQVAEYVFGVEPEKVTGRQRNKVTDSLRRLAKNGVLEYEPGRGRAAVATIGFAEPSETHPTVGGVSSPETYPDPGLKAPRSGTKSTPLGWHSEKVSEKVSEENFGDVSEPDPSHDSMGRSFTPERANERNEYEAWCADVPSDVRPFWLRVASYTRGNVKLKPDTRLVGAVRDAMQRSGQSVTALAGSLEPGRWPATFNQSAEAYAMWRLGQVEQRPRP